MDATTTAAPAPLRLTVVSGLGTMVMKREGGRVYRYVGGARGLGGRWDTATATEAAQFHRAAQGR